ncbi:cysteine hydrolase family protein [Xanthocytophaga flava]|uniref:cysteine hydrolase family protein n=1 Tax=Xanthocytophaga flava TaxID=3048013 RepID=UPI0028D10158|nr:cysteine hydrolase family protein [Xanthocytophaga flavus]MDJ1473231.1 cysteine hydrolase family protein [Xanthocytophaga flavus]
MNQPVLLIIDAQKGIDEATHWGGNRNNPEAERRILQLLEHWRKQKWPVCHVYHDSAHPQSPFYPGKVGNEHKPGFEPLSHEVVLRKSTTNAFINTNLELYLSRNQFSTLVVTGFVTNNSVEATVRMAGDSGYAVWVISDGVATFNKKGLDGQVYDSELVHTISLANMQGEYATIISTEELLSKLPELYQS